VSALSTAALPGTALVVGFARTGRAIARVLAAGGTEVVVVEDAPTDEARRAASELGVELVGAPPPARAAALAAAAEIVVPSPGVPPHHPALGGVPAEKVVSEIELAWEIGRARLLAVTGTNGKTTVTSLATEMLVRSGIRARAAGNIGTPLIEVLAEGTEEVVVAEVSSFQLAFTHRFHPAVAAYLNFSPDHLDWHPDLAHYAAAKARIFANQAEGDVAVANAEDPVTLSAAAAGRARLVSFGLGDGDYREVAGRLLGPGGIVVAHVDELARAFPHDRRNGLAAAAVAAAAGASTGGIRAALLAARPLPHRVALVGSRAGVRFYDDSKATTPAAVAAALEGFDSVVLIAGGRNKGLDLGEIAVAVRDRQRATGAPRLRAVVAIGEAAAEVEAALAPLAPVERADSMEEAVRRAAAHARAGDAVLLSPGCASFDWYRSYAERGEDFARAVDALARAEEGGR